MSDEIWSEFEVPTGRWAFWQIGPLELFAKPSAGEWRFAWRAGGPDHKTEEIRIPAKTEPPKENFEFGRYAMSKPGNTISLLPSLADRAVVIRPETKLFLLPGEEASLFVTTPIWVSVLLRGNRLFEVPVQRPSDSWFGPDTRSGELCYSIRTRARISAEQLETVADRAITPLWIANQADDLFPVDALRLPVTALSVLAGDDGRLWTETIAFEREEDGTVASVRIARRRKLGPKEGRSLSQPREPLPRRKMVETLSKLFK